MSSSLTAIHATIPHARIGHKEKMRLNVSNSPGELNCTFGVLGKKQKHHRYRRQPVPVRVPNRVLEQVEVEQRR